MPPTAAIVHDYLLERGGAERVVLSMVRAFPGAPVYTSLYDPDRTFPEFRDVDVRPMERLNSVRVLRRHHRLGAPLYGPAFRRLSVEADVCFVSSSGWAHAVGARGRKVVYCHNPAGWLYQTGAYLKELPAPLRPAARAAVPWLRRQDRRAAAGADTYLVNSTEVRGRVLRAYGMDAEVLAPPPGLTPGGAMTPLDVPPGFVLAVSRLLLYKNIDAVVRAATSTGRPLVVAGEGRDRERLEAMAGPTVRLVGSVTDAQLRWLYANCSAVVAAAYEDFGLTPVEANSFGIPVAALRWGGYLDTVVEGRNGVLFDRPEPDAIVSALDRLDAATWEPERLREHARAFSEERFVSRLRELLSAPERAGRA